MHFSSSTHSKLHDSSELTMQYFSDHATSQLSSVYWVGEVTAFIWGSEIRLMPYTVAPTVAPAKNSSQQCMFSAVREWNEVHGTQRFVNEDKEDQYRVTSLKASAMHILTLYRWSETGGNTNIRIARLMTRYSRKFFTRLRGVRVCGDAVLLDFWCGFTVIFIFSCGIAVLQNQAVCGI